MSANLATIRTSDNLFINLCREEETLLDEAELSLLMPLTYERLVVRTPFALEPNGRRREKPQPYLQVRMQSESVPSAQHDLPTCASGVMGRTFERGGVSFSSLLVALDADFATSPAG